MEMKRRVVVCGLGSIGRRHVRLLRERADVIVEIVEPDTAARDAAAAEGAGLRVHESFEAMLATAPDIVWIATPTPLHAEQSIRALRAGAHVFCEKPMCDCTQDALRVKRTVEETGRAFNVGFMWRFSPAFRFLKDLVAQGRLGNIVHAHARVGTYITLVNSRSRYQSRTPGSLFLDYSHQPDLFYWLLGEVPSYVSVAGLETGRMEFSSDPNVAAILYTYNRPLLATIHLNYVQMPQVHEYEVVGDEAWAKLSFPSGRIDIGSKQDQRVRTEEFPLVVDDLYRAQQQAFLEAVAGMRTPETPAGEGLISTALAEASLRSYRTGGRVGVGGVLDSVS